MTDQLPPAEGVPAEPLPRKPSPFDLVVQPAWGFRGRIYRFRGFLPESSPWRMRIGQPVSPTGAPPAGPSLSALAVIAFILAFLVPLVGAILGHVALARTKTLGQDGRGYALAAIIIGYVFTAVVVLVILGIQLLVNRDGGMFNYGV